jgi:hypothetical protein
MGRNSGCLIRREIQWKMILVFCVKALLQADLSPRTLAIRKLLEPGNMPVEPVDVMLSVRMNSISSKISVLKSSAFSFLSTSKIILAKWERTRY